MKRKSLMSLAIIAVFSAVFSLSAAAASACDGMKGHDRASDSQAKNENGKADSKGDTKGKPGTTKSRSDEGTNKS